MLLGMPGVAFGVFFCWLPLAALLAIVVPPQLWNLAVNKGKIGDSYA
jgi:hypothetical protein